MAQGLVSLIDQLGPAWRRVDGLVSAASVPLAAAGAAWLVQWILYAVLRKLARRSRWKFDDVLLRRIKRPWRLLFPCLALLIVLPFARTLPREFIEAARHVTSLALIATVVWMVLAALSAAEEHVKRTNSLDVEDNYAARRAYTKVTVLRRSAAVFVILVGASLVLMTFPKVRQVGTSLLASAGVAGLIVGLAARPLLENLIAGVQIALTQPFNIDDVVIIEKEWGWIEEITATYVVVRIWDQRRLIVPFSKFIHEPFENWTRRTSQILGTVFVYADYTVPVPAVREELERIVRLSNKWDGRVCVLQVTAATERSVELRALVSAANSPAAWDLRVFVREKLIEFLKREFPGSLPRTRLELPAQAAAAPKCDRAEARAA